MRKIILTALLSSAATVLLLRALPAGDGISQTTKLDNPRVTVTEVTAQPASSREPYVRPSDQVIVFLDDCSYDRVDPKTKQRTRVNRKSGEVIWHSKGEQAPQLINAGSKPYRTLAIALK